LFKVSTGGSFETAGRKIDPIRAIEAYEISAQLIHILRFAAKEQVSLRALLSTLYYKVTGRP
jgi:3-deoxy-D-arabino-heptulosonate 7-phosphate (DAHP) synthase class II